MTDRLRVLQITPTLGSGGAERVVVELLRQLHPVVEQQVALLYPIEDEQALFFKPELDALGIPVTYLDKHPGKLARLSLLWRYGKLLRRFQPDIIHAHQWHPMDIVRGARGIFRGYRVMVTPHTLIPDERRYVQEGRLVWAADRIVVVSKGIEAQYRARIPASVDRLMVIPNGVDAAFFTPGDRAEARRLALPVLPKDAVIGLFLGRFHPVKNLDVLFEGVRRLVVTDRWNPRARIVCVGRAEDQAYVDRLQAFINIHHLGDIIHLTAARREVLPLYRACDFLLVVSHHEGLPVVVLEAGAAGRPAVVSQAANSDEIVLDGQSGWIVPTGDAEALASRLEQVIQLPTAERDRMGLAAREHIQRRFDIRQSAQQYLRVYHNLLERGG